MIEWIQHHRCWWSRRRLTEITLSSGALHGVGAGISALLFALADAKHIYAVRLDSDNAVFLTLPSNTADEDEESSEPILPAHLRDQFGITEKPIGKALQEELAIDFVPDRALVGRPERAEQVIEMHDDCFFHFVSKDPMGFEQALSGILALHGTYLRQRGLGAVGPQLFEHLRSEGTLRLQSQPAVAKVRLLRRRQGGVARWLRPWTTLGCIEQRGSAWRIVPKA